MKFEAKIVETEPNDSKSFSEMETIYIKRDLLKSFLLSLLVIAVIAAIYLVDNNPNLINYILRR